MATGFADVAAILVCVSIAARFSDGPVGPFPGGALTGGRLVDHPVLDWAFVADVAEVDLQLVSPPRSRRTWILFHAGNAYIPCGLPNLRILKQWPHQAVLDGRAVVRVRGERFPVQLTRVEDAALQRELRSRLEVKYPTTNVYPVDVWFFAVAAGRAS